MYVKFDVDYISDISERFEIPLKQARMTCNNDELLNEQHKLITYKKKRIEPVITSYLHTWKIVLLPSSATTGFKNIFLLIELCFRMSVGNAELKWLFLRLKRIKTDSRSFVGSTRLMKNIVSSGHEGASVKGYALP